MRSPRPDVNARVRDIGNLAIDLVRVLDDQHQAVGPWHPHLEIDELQVGLRHMLLTRVFDDRMQRTQRQGKISFYMRSLGEEAVSVAQCMALRPTDMLFPSYRNQGFYMVRGRPLVDLMCQLLSNTRDMCKGRQLPVMYHWAEGRIFSISGNLTTQFPQAVGWAMAAAIKGNDDIAASWIGEGSSAEADFHHAMLFASVYQAPVILNVVNNQWAISTFQGFAGGEQRSFAARGPGYGMAGIRVDGNDFLAVYAVTQWAAERARSRRGPDADRARHLPWCGALDQRRSGALPAEERLREVAARRSGRAPQESPDRARRMVGGAACGAHRELDGRSQPRWKEARKYGTLNEGPRLDRELMFEDVFKEMPDHLRAAARAAACGAGLSHGQMNMIQALNSAMDIMLARDPNVVVLGEDVGYFGGVFRVTDGLQRKYGEHRVLDTPIAEGAIVGAAIGMGVNGLRPVAEVQFADYIYPACDQIFSELARLRYRSARRVLGAGHDPHALRRRHPRRADAFAESRRHFHARLRHQGRDAVEPLRRQGPADRRDRGRRSGRVLRAEARSTTARSTAIRTSPPCRGARTRRAKCPTGITPCRSAMPRSCARAASSRS